MEKRTFPSEILMTSRIRGKLWWVPWFSLFADPGFCLFDPDSFLYAYL